MKTSNTWSFRSIVGKIMVGLVLAAMIGSIDVAPALGKNDKHDKGRYEQRGRGYDRDRYQGRHDYRPYGYAPPPVDLCPASTAGYRNLFSTDFHSLMRFLYYDSPAFMLS
jgi:hypothetical protein